MGTINAYVLSHPTPAGQAKRDRGPSYTLAGQVRGGELVSVAHFGEQEGDLMRVPEIVFEVVAGAWNPVSIQQDYVGSSREAVFVGEDGKVYVRPALVRDIAACATSGIAT